MTACGLRRRLATPPTIEHRTDVGNFSVGGGLGVVHCARVKSGAMSMKSRRCAACKKAFKPNVRAKTQRFCSQKSCQRERRRREQKNRRRSDPDYRANERRAQERRREKNPHYSRDYRQKNPDYTQRNRLQQHERDKKRRSPNVTNERLLATEASSTGIPSVKSGIYELRPVAAEGVLATEASLTVEISVLSGG
jgi:hypothetical protein